MIMPEFVFGSIFHVWEKTWDLCLSKLGLLHITQCFPVPRIYKWMTKFHSSLWMNNIHIYHIFITHSSVVRHVDYFHSLAIVNNAAINVNCKSLYYILIHTPLDLSLGAKLLDHMAFLFSVIWGSSILLSIVVVKCCIHPYSI
jgi:hypothetical protein